VFRRGTDYVITLPYGSGADWVKNVLAANGCELRTRGKRIKLSSPAVFNDNSEVAIPGVLRRMLSWMKVSEFLALTPATSDVVGR
jgi:hypothetical protein